MNYRYWLHRGRGIKRWILLASGGPMLASVGLLAPWNMHSMGLALVGRDLVTLIEGSLLATGGSGALAV